MAVQLTDCLVERRDQDIDGSLDGLQKAVGRADGDESLQSTLHRLVSELTIGQDRGDDITALLIRRNVWAQEVSALRQALLNGIGAGNQRVLLDVADVTFMDSSGFAVLLTAFKRLKAVDGELRIAGADPAVRS